MTRFLASLVLGASLLGLAACSGGAGNLTPAASQYSAGSVQRVDGGMPTGDGGMPSN